VELTGKAQVLPAGLSEWRLVAKGDTLSNGDQLHTFRGAKATLAFDDGSKVEIGPNSNFTLDTSATEGVSVRLTLGSLRSWVEHMAGRRFEVHTPTAVCSVRGTEFSVDVDAQGRTGIQMFSGILAVGDNRGNEMLIRDRESLRVSDRGLGDVKGRRAEGLQPTLKQKLKELAKRESGFETAKESVQAAVAGRTLNAVYQEGKTVININGDRVRIEEYIVRPTPTSFKLVVLDYAQHSMNYFYYHGIFNTTLPTDLSIALSQIQGCINTSCQYYMTGYDTGRSNGIDTMLEVASGGHQIDVNNDGYSYTPPSGPTQTDAVYYAFNTKTNQYTTITVGAPGINTLPVAQGGNGTGLNQSFFQTLFDYDTLTFDGVPHGGWVPADATQAIANGGPGIANFGVQGQGAGAATSITSVLFNGSIVSPTTLTSPQYLQSTQNPGGCSPPNCTYNDPGIIHEVVYEANNDGSTWDKFDSYIISDAGKVATQAAFAGTTSGTTFNEVMLHYNFEMVVTASEFQGRSIDLVVAPKLFIESGLIP